MRDVVGAGVGEPVPQLELVLQPRLPGVEPRDIQPVAGAPAHLPKEE